MLNSISEYTIIRFNGFLVWSVILPNVPGSRAFTNVLERLRTWLGGRYGLRFGPQFIIILFPFLLPLTLFIGKEAFFTYSYGPSDVMRCLLHDSVCSGAAATWFGAFVVATIAFATAVSVRSRFFAAVERDPERKQISRKRNVREQVRSGADNSDEGARRQILFSLKGDEFAVTVVEKTDKTIALQIERIG